MKNEINNIIYDYMMYSRQGNPGVELRDYLMMRLIVGIEREQERNYNDVDADNEPRVREMVDEMEM